MVGNDAGEACASSVPRTLAAVLADLERRAAEADAIGATAPVGSVYRAAIALLEPLPASSIEAPATKPPDRLLTVQEVADRMGVTPRYVYDNMKRLPFMKKLGGRTARGSERGLEKWLAQARTG